MKRFEDIESPEELEKQLRESGSGATIAEVKLTEEDKKFVECRTFTREEIAYAAGITLRSEKKPPKYRNQRTQVETVYGPVMCDSKKEAREVFLADQQVRAGQLKAFLVQVTFRLHGKGRHRVDIAKIWPDNTITFHEVKGREHPMGLLKRRQVEELYKIEIEVIR